MRAYLE
jgi:hypothetical protein